MRMLLDGSGKQTIVFESGAGASLEAWIRVQPSVSKFAKTISYDRAGNGLSHRGEAPRDGLRIASELHTALQKAGATPPYILVGHSLGGPYVRLFAALYPDEVAALVLVDPTQEDLIEWGNTQAPKRARKEHNPFHEVDCAEATFSQLKQHPFPKDIPVLLITGMGPRSYPAFLPAEMKVELEKARRISNPTKLKFHKEWVEQFPRGELTVAEQSGHGIPFEEPDLIVRVIRQAMAVTPQNPPIP